MSNKYGEIELPEVDTEFEPHDDHPELTEEEVADGEVMYHDIDDLDDYSNGLDDEEEGEEQ